MYTKTFFLTLLLAVFWLFWFSSQAQASLGLWDIDVSFCNGENRLVINGTTDSMTDYCFIVSNSSSTAWLVQLQIVDGQMTLWENPVQACKTSSDWLFSQFVSLPEKDPISIDANESLRITWKIDLPEWFAGNLYGCLTSTIPAIQQDDGSMFTIVNRKANLMQLSVGWSYVASQIFNNPISSDQLQELQKADKIYSADWDNFIVIWNSDTRSATPTVYMQNSGYTAEEYSISGTSSLWIFSLTLWDESFVIQEKWVLYAWDDILLQETNSALPRWAFGTLSVSLDAIHAPYDATELLSDITTNDRSSTATFFVAPHPFLLMWLGIILLLIVFVFVYSRKKTSS